MYDLGLGSVPDFGGGGDFDFGGDFGDLGDFGDAVGANWSGGLADATSDQAFEGPVESSPAETPTNSLLDLPPPDVMPPAESAVPAPAPAPAPADPPVDNRSLLSRIEGFSVAFDSDNGAPPGATPPASAREVQVDDGLYEEAVAALTGTQQWVMALPLADADSHMESMPFDLESRFTALEGVGDGWVMEPTAPFGGSPGGDFALVTQDSRPDDALEDFASSGMPFGEQWQANFDQIVGAFSEAVASPIDRSQDIQLAAYRSRLSPGIYTTYGSNYRFSIDADGKETQLVDLERVTITGTRIRPEPGPSAQARMDLAQDNFRRTEIGEMNRAEAAEATVAYLREDFGPPIQPVLGTTLVGKIALGATERELTGSTSVAAANPGLSIHGELQEHLRSAQQRNVEFESKDAAFWSARFEELNRAAARYKELNTRPGHPFTSDSIYNGLKADAMQAKILAGMAPNESDYNQSSRLMIENGPAAGVGLAAAVGGLKAGGVGGGLRTDLPKHLAGPDGFTKSGQLSGTHNLDNAIASLNAKAATYTLSKTGTPGISELKYTYTDPSTGKLVSGSKTVYDPKVHSDQAMLERALQAAQSAWAQFMVSTSTAPPIFDVVQTGVSFRVYINYDKNGIPFIGNVHPIK